MSITVHYPEDMAAIPKEDQAHFINTMGRALHWGTGDRTVEIFMDNRKENGWLEYGINVRSSKTNERIIFIGAIQRSLNAESEFHS